MIPIEAPIVGVIVYSDRARITRRGTVPLAAGENVVMLSALPDNLQDQSVQVTGNASSVEIIALHCLRYSLADPLREAKKSEQGALEVALAGLQKAQQRLEREKLVIQKRLENLDRLSLGIHGHLGEALVVGRARLEDIPPLSGHLENELRSALEAQEQNADEISAGEKAIKVTEAEIRSRAPSVTFQKQVEMTLLAEAPVAVELTLEYQVNGASWRPAYVARLERNSLIQFQYLAYVNQQTGEDWPELPLTLSTAQLSKTPYLPQIEVWRIDKEDPEVIRLSAKKREQEARNAMEDVHTTPLLGARITEDQQSKTYEEKLKIARMQTESSDFSVDYRGEQALAIPSDGQSYAVTIAELQLPCEFDFVCVPRVQQGEVIRRAKIVNHSEYMLVPGSVRLTRQGREISRVNIPLIAPDEQFPMPLAVEERVKVYRRMIEHRIERLEEEKIRRIHYRFSIQIANYLDEPIKLTLRDNLPLSMHEGIRVIPGEITPTPVSQSEMNIVKWVVELEAGAEQEIQHNFVVECPLDMVLSGIV